MVVYCDMFAVFLRDQKVAIFARVSIGGTPISIIAWFSQNTTNFVHNSGICDHIFSRNLTNNRVFSWTFRWKYVFKNTFSPKINNDFVTKQTDFLLQNVNIFWPTFVLKSWKIDLQTNFFQWILFEEMMI